MKRRVVVVNAMYERLALAALGETVLHLGDDVDERNRHDQIVKCGANVGRNVARGGREVFWRTA